MYLGCWISASLLISILDVFIKKQISNVNIILTSFKYFLDLPWPLSIDAKVAKGADIGDNYIGSADVRDIYTGNVYTKDTYIGGTCIKGACIRDTCFRGANIGVVCIGGAYTSNIYAKSTYARNTYFAVSAYIKSAGPENICSSANKSSKSSIKGSRLLVELISKMPVSFCLHLQVILDSFL